MFFLFVADTRRCVIIDRKSLTFQPKSIDDVVRTAIVDYIEFSCTVRPDLFRGTLLDVKMVNNLFYVYNVFMWKGDDRSNESSLESFRLLNNERLEVVQPVKEYSYRDLKRLKETMQEDSRVTGIVFVPKIPGNQMIFLTNRQQVKATLSETQQTTQDDDVVFLMYPNSLPDVYLLEKETSDGRKKNQKILAYIPDEKTSRKWREYIADKKCVKVKCNYIASIDKYVPVTALS